VRKSRYSDEQIAAALRQAEAGTEVTPRFLDGLGAYFGLPAAPFDRR
jgi:hypothetical protein